MTQEEKELLLQDLSARLPYGVIVELDKKFGFNKGTHTLVKELLDLYCVEGIKPYLRPMSSMTEEEEDLLNEFNCYYINGELFFSCGHSQEDIYNAVDWLNAHHFDYRGLIGRGLALESPEGMYN